LENSPYADKIEFIIGDVMQLLPPMAKERNLTFDMAFVDGDKRHYIGYYEMLLPHLTPGALLLADNTLWDGHVIDPAYDRDAQTKGIRAFNDHIAGDNRVEKVILPLRDGLTLIRKK
jgi:predicted O-methyltransferase YrrM